MGQTPPTAAQGTQLPLTHVGLGALKEKLENSMGVQELATWKTQGKPSSGTVSVPLPGILPTAFEVLPLPSPIPHYKQHQLNPGAL